MAHPTADNRRLGGAGLGAGNRASPIIHLVAILLAPVNPVISIALHIAVASMWLVPDRRIERLLATS